MARNTVLSVARKYSVVIFFPSFAAATIFADWSHTRRWKREQALLKPRQEELTQ